MVLGIMKIIHIGAFAGLFMALGALAFHGLNGGTRETNNAKLWPIITHGASLLVLFITGFGLLGVMKTGFPYPWWVWAKFALFLALGGFLVLVNRKSQMANVWWIALPVLGMCAAIFIQAGLYGRFSG
jgi:hypothetical protein